MGDGGGKGVGVGVEGGKPKRALYGPHPQAPHPKTPQPHGNPAPPPPRAHHTCPHTHHGIAVGHEGCGGGRLIRPHGCLIRPYRRGVRHGLGGVLGGAGLRCALVAAAWRRLVHGGGVTRPRWWGVIWVRERVLAPPYPRAGHLACATVCGTSASRLEATATSTSVDTVSHATPSTVTVSVNRPGGQQQSNGRPAPNRRHHGALYHAQLQLQLSGHCPRGRPR